jgi:apolipoprotein N-acyltransferase
VRSDHPPEGGTSSSPVYAGVRIALLLAGGAALAAVFIDPDLWVLGWVALGPLFWFAPRAPTVRKAALEGWLVGLAVNIPAFYWLVETIHRFGGFPLPIALFFYAALSAYSALQFAIVAAALRWAGPGAPALVAPAIWTAVEFLFPNLFPWRLGHSQRELLWLLQIGDLTGPYGLSFLIAWLASVCTTPTTRPRRLAPAALALGLALLYGAWRAADVERAVELAPPFSIGVVQGNLALDEKRHQEHFESNVERYRRLSLALEPEPNLYVWPETVVEWGIPRGVALAPRLDPFPGAPVPLLFGAVSYRRVAGADPLWFNSAFLRSTTGELVGHYDKIVLMPFGEFIPFATWFPALKDLSPNTGDFQPGAGPAVLPASQEARIGPLICYEDLLAGHVRDTVRSGATVLATIANDAWFGVSAALEQHETLALWRAIENRRFLVRVTNTGLTSVIDPLGRRVAALPVTTEAASTVTIRLMDTATAYTAVGDVFGWSVVLLAISLLATVRRSDRMVRAEDAKLPRKNEV